MLLALAAIWGSSFMFIEIALRDLAPSTLILFRMGSGALALAVYVKARRPPLRARSARTRGRSRCSALVNTAVPFFLIAWGQQYIDSGPRGDPQRLGPALHRALRDRVRPEPARHRHAARRRRRSASAASSCSSASSSAAASARSPAGSRSSARRPATGSAASTRAAASPACRRRSSPSARSSGRRSSCSRSEPRRRARSAGRRSSPCSTSASPRPASPTSSTSA